MTKHFDLSELRRRAVIERDRRQRLSEQKAEAEDDLLAFIRMFWHCIEPTTVFVNGWVIEAIADALMAVSEGEITRLLINVAPGSMKSMMLNIAFPLWEWGPRNKPSERYISASYSSSLTERDNGRMLRILRDPIYQQCWPYVVVEREGLVKIENTATGWKLATSIGGTLTGMRAGKILLDDVNNPANVESAVVRAQTNLVVREVLPDRLENLKTGAIISIQQRTHEEDATGTLAKYGDSYEWLCIPTEFDPLRNFPLVLRRDDEGRAVDVWRDPRGLDENGDELEGTYTDDRGNLAVRMGSPMAQADGVLAWPERFPREAIEEQKRIKGPYAFAGQYQQLPSARGGGMILRDWWQPWMSEEYPDLGTVIGSLDTAVEEGRNNDYNAFITFGAFGAPSGEPKLILTSAWRLRATLAELAARTAESCYRYKVDYLLIERRTRGKDLHDELLRLYAGAPWQTVLVEPTNSKADRLKSVAHLFSGDCRRDPVTGIDVYSGGMVYAPMKDWSDEVITEVANFPAAAHDDYCFVAGTMIATSRGGIPIESVRRGDMALTPFGWMPVICAAFTGLQPVVSRHGLTATHGHRVYTLDSSYQPLYSLGRGDRLARLSLCGLIRTILLSSSSSMASLSEGWEAPENTISRKAQQMLGERAPRASMWSCGKPTMRPRSRQTMKSITKMGMCLILATITWSAYRKACIGAYLKRMRAALRFLPTLINNDPLPLCGTSLMQGERGIASTLPRLLRWLGLPEMPLRRELAGFAYGVGAPSSSEILERNSAPTGAVVPRCERVVDGSVRPVFNLSVSGPKCYYANGILVHNCDAVSQAMIWVRKNGVALRKTEYEAEQIERRTYKRPVRVPYAIARE